MYTNTAWNLFQFPGVIRPKYGCLYKKAKDVVIVGASNRTMIQSMPGNPLAVAISVPKLKPLGEAVGS